MTEAVETVVIGGGQSGLATGFYLKERGLPFLIIDENERVGDVWRNRWDSLQLFTPARYDALPGMDFPGSTSAYPSKDEVADYFEAYARRFDLPIRNETRARGLTRAEDGRFIIECGGDSLIADNVVVATGAYLTPEIPWFASDLDPGIRQLHSSEYHRPSDLAEGAALVVGAGNSGAEIAMDLIADHQVFLSGRDPGQEPTRAGSVPDRLLTPLIWLMATRFTVETPMGRKLRDHFLDPPRGIPLGRVRRKDLARAGIERVGRASAVEDGRPRLEDGRVLDVASVIWCTGFRPDYDWIGIPLPRRFGYPEHRRGVVEGMPGLYFMGLLFQYSLSSALLGGVGRDARHVVEHLTARHDADRGVSTSTTLFG